MTDFSTTATLEVELDDRSVRNVEQQLQSRIGTTEVGMTDGGTMSAQAAGGGGGGGRQRRRARQSHRWERQRTDDIEEMVELLRGIEGGGDGSGLMDLIGGGAGGILGGAGSALGGALGPAVGTAVGSAAGNAISDALSGEDVVLDADDFSMDVEAEEIGAVEVSVASEEIDDVGVDVDTEELENFQIGIDTERIDDFELGVDVEEMEDLVLDLDHPDEPYPISDEHLPLEVEEVDPIPVESVDPIDISVDVSGGMGGQAGSDSTGYEGTVGEGIRNQVLEPVFGSEVADLDRRATDKLRDWSPFHDAPERDTGSTGDTGSSPPTGTGGSTTVTTTVDPQPTEINTEVGPVNVRVEDLDRMVDEVVSEVRDVVEDVRDDLEREIDENARDISDLEREITGR